MGKSFFIFFSLLVISFTNAQQKYWVGYQKKIAGTNFTYHSPLSNTEKCLLSRAKKDFSPLIWQTEKVPKTYKKKTISFVWLYGIAVTSDAQAFEVHVNNLKVATFYNPSNNEAKTWSAKAAIKDFGLVFHKTMVDVSNDQMGFAVLTMPTKKIALGRSVTIKIAPINNDSSHWYMTYKVPLKERITITQLGVVGKDKKNPQHIVRFDIIHLSDKQRATLTIGDKNKTVILVPGLNEINFSLKATKKKISYTAKIIIDGKKPSRHRFILKPVKKWTINLVQHSHTDIGYTRSQTDILAEHLRFIDYALDYCDQTDDYPDRSKFRWTCEAAWTVREYLKSRPKEQIDRLLKRIKEGRIEVTGMFFNFSEVVDETALAIQTKTLKLFKEKGIAVKTAMQNDVNGIGWCMVDLYKNTGVKYLTMGQHGHRAHVPFDKPTSFWWESPAGNRLLAYRSEHYMHGNALQLTAGDLDVFRSNLSNYLKDLENKGYPFLQTAFQFSGYVTDNSPPSITACDIVKVWNEKYEWPKLKISLAGEFMVYLEKNKSKYLPIKKVAWPDWWTDGFGSAMQETKVARNTQAEMISNMGLFSMAKMMGAKMPDGIQDDIRNCYDNLLFYDEHTFGSEKSISDPLDENVVVQWGQKAAYAWSALKQSGILKEKALGCLQPFIKKSDIPTITIFNTLNWNRSGLVHIYIDHQILPLDKKFKIVDSQGNIVNAHLQKSRNDGSYWNLWVKDVPAFGYKSLRIEVDKTKPKEEKINKHLTLENSYYKVILDKERGFIRSIFDKNLDMELVDQKSKVPLGTIIYEEIAHRRYMERLTNTNRDTVYVPLKKQLHYLNNITVSEVTQQELWKSVKIKGRIDKCADKKGITIEIRLYNDDKRIELLYGMRKLKVTTPEGLYIAFPFYMTDTDNLRYEVQGGVIQPGKNQLEGTASDWNAVQNFASVTNAKAQILLNTKDIPLVQFGDINTGHFYYKHQPKKSHIYSWVLNNYWTTNFKASQEGGMTWSYIITSTDNNSTTYATRFGWENTVPLAARVIPKGQKKQTTLSKTILNVDIPNILLVNAKLSSNGKGIILHLRETEGNHAILDINRLKKEIGAVSISEVNVLEEVLQALQKPLSFEHFETKFLFIEL